MGKTRSTHTSFTFIHVIKNLYLPTNYDFQNIYKVIQSQEAKLSTLNFRYNMTLIVNKIDIYKSTLFTKSQNLSGCACVCVMDP